MTEPTTTAKRDAATTERIAHRLLDLGSCADCGAPVRNLETARGHAARDGFACQDFLHTPAGLPEDP